LMHKQVFRIEQLHLDEKIDLFKMLEIKQFCNSFIDEQGKAERIKNFPFPRQYASTTLWVTWIFALLLPWSMMNVVTNVSINYIWLTVPLTALVIWVFFLMERIGDYSENPFEGNYNDVPITSIVRAIEIDIREMINDNDIPPPIKAEKGFLL
jgi:ion channel-forming bestrophin family protein